GVAFELTTEGTPSRRSPRPLPLLAAQALARQAPIGSPASGGISGRRCAQRQGWGLAGAARCSISATPCHNGPDAANTKVSGQHRAARNDEVTRPGNRLATCLCSASLPGASGLHG